jgi:hypothetical protein
MYTTVTTSEYENGVFQNQVISLEVTFLQHLFLTFADEKRIGPIMLNEQLETSRTK